MLWILANKNLISNSLSHNNNSNNRFRQIIKIILFKKTQISVFKNLGISNNNSNKIFNNKIFTIQVKGLNLRVMVSSKQKFLIVKIINIKA